MPGKRPNLSGLPSAPAAPSAPKVRFYSRPWAKRLLIGCAALLLVAGGYEGYRRARRVAAEATDRRLADAKLRVEIVHPPGWLSPELLDMVLKEVQVFAEETVPAKPGPDGQERPAISNFDRLRSPVKDELAAPRQVTDLRTGRTFTRAPEVLRELAEHYQTHQAERSNAWISRIISIERVYNEGRNEQVIRIRAEFRKPIAFVAQGDKYYLVEKITQDKWTEKGPDGKQEEKIANKAIRLPGEYSEADRKLMSGLLMVRGVDEGLPEPGQPWTSPGAIGGLQLVELLNDAVYRDQIAAIDVSNIAGKKDALGARIVLDTIFPNPQNPNEPTRVWWGLPPDYAHLPLNQRFWEPQPAVKLKALQLLFARYNRIDARAPYVDIRLEDPRIPKPVSPGSSMADSPASHTIGHAG